MLSNGTIVGDGSWVLRIHVTDINVDREFRVKGDMHIGGVMLRLVDDLGKIRFFSFLRFFCGGSGLGRLIGGII